ncbi:MAG: butyrate kinase [Planctomycetota bacterium]|nr:MAG: butyrate kinase [Planctomycetota bacterium]
MTHRILAINPGSTSTKLGLFEDDKLILNETINHPGEDISKIRAAAPAGQTAVAQKEYRLKAVLDFLAEAEVDPSALDAVVGRGGPVRPIPAGTYRVNDALVADLVSDDFIDHASCLGGVLAREVADMHDIPSFIVDPVCVDEYEPVARISGHPELPRKSLNHALNKRAVARRVAAEMGKKYEECRFIVSHLGGGVTVSAHRCGRMVDSSDANGEGPFAPERSGSLRVDDLTRRCFSGKVDLKTMLAELNKRGGMAGELGTSDAREVEKRIDEGDERAKLVYEAMAYQNAKTIAALTVALDGKVDAIILTGGLANSKRFTKMVEEHIGWLAPVKVYPGSREQEALGEGALRVLCGEEKARIYPTGDFE